MHRITKLAVVAAIVAAVPLAASARSSLLTSFNTKYGTANTVLDDCQTCHGSGGTSTYNPYGAELRNNIGSGIATALNVADPKDSDNDGYANGVEAKALTFPGDSKSFPAATTAPAIAVSPASLDFRTVTVGSPSTQTVTVANGGTATLSVTSIARCSGTSTEFTTSASSLTVAAGGRASFNVSYAPTASGTDSGCIALASNASPSTVQVSVTGTGQAVVVTAPAIAVAPTSLSFGTVTAGGTANQTTIVSNNGDADLLVSSVARCNGTSAEYTASPASFALAPGVSQTVTVTYSPVDATTDTGCVAIASNDTAAGTQNVAVSGTGQAVANPVADVDITRFSVAKRLDISRGGTTQPKLAVVNAGTVQILAGQVTITVEATDANGVLVYSATDDTLVLAPGAAAKVVFPQFVPTGAAQLTWTATVADAAPDVDVATAATKVVP